jgi:DnaJ-class molecular chaperone
MICEACKICEVCNGKGYVIEKGRELACSECQGQGEYDIANIGNAQNLKDRTPLISQSLT